MGTITLERDTATVSSKGQVTIPKHLREELSIETGTKLQFVRKPGGRIEIVPKTGRIEDLFGVLRGTGVRPMTIEEMDDAIAEAAAASGMRGMESWDEPEWEEEDWERK